MLKQGQKLEKNGEKYRVGGVVGEIILLVDEKTNGADNCTWTESELRKNGYIWQEEKLDDETYRIDKVTIRGQSVPFEQSRNELSFYLPPSGGGTGKRPDIELELISTNND